MRLKAAVLIALVFLAALVLAFPYETLVRYKLSHAAPNLRYESLDAAPWGVRLTGVQAPVTLEQKLVFDEVRVRPSGIFPPAFRLEMVRSAGRISAEFSFPEKRMTFEGSVADVRIQDILPSFPGGLNATVNMRAEGQMDLKTKDGSIALTEIRVKSETGGFEGTAEIRPLVPLHSATVHLKGTATIGPQTMPLDKSVPVGDFLSAG